METFKNGNVLVKSALTLIDYDGVFVPALPRGGGTELGHKHFQHPKRSAADFGPEMDRFSFAVLDLSLRALVAEPRLFEKHSNGENILLTANDFLDPGNSSAFADLKAIPALARDAANLANISAAPIAAVPSLEDFLAGRNIPAASTLIRAPSPSARSSTQGEAQYVGAFEVVDATNFDAASRQIGNRVEFIGQVIKVHVGRTRHGGRPYAFVFFNHTKRGVKLNIWNDGLAKLADGPSQAWMGRWLSVQGLVDPTYDSGKYGTSVSITITSSSQIRTISAEEARRRQPAPRPITASQASSNADIMRQLEQHLGTGSGSRSGRSPPSRGRVHSPPPAPPVSPNQALLNSIRAGSTSSPSTSSPGALPRPATPYQPTPKREVPWGAIIVGAFIVFIIAKGLRII